MIVISNNLVLSQESVPSAVNENNPLVGWVNFVVAGNLEATQSDQDHPVTNLANNSTFYAWQSENSGPFTISCDIGVMDEIDYLAIAGHNLVGRVVSVQGSIGEVSGSPEEEIWFDLISDVVISDNSPILFRFEKGSLSSIRLNVSSGSATARIAVMYVGTLLVLQRRIYVGHKVLKYNRSTDQVTPRSMNGNFLGRIVMSETLNSQLELQNITPSFYRQSMDPWLKDAIINPFFFAWRPGDYPLEVGYCWLTGDSAMTNQLPNGMVQVSMSLEGISE